MTRAFEDSASDRYRRSIALDGEWEFLVDPKHSGRTNRWYDRNATWPDRAHAVELPRAWQEDETYREYTGTAWYRRSIELDAAVPAGERAFLAFDAVDYETTVWVNGNRVGENRGGYLPFEMDVTDALERGENVIAVAVTDPEDLSEIPHGKQGDPWYTRVSGIWQSVRLEYRPETRIVDAPVTPDLERDRAVVDLEFATGPADIESLRATVLADLNGDSAASATVSLSSRSTAVLEFDDPTYWHPDEPALYDLTVVLERDGTIVDRYEDYFGLRSFETDGGEFLLNGEPITLRGVLEQGYYPETLYRPGSEETFESEIELASDLGFNLIRKHVKPAHPDFLECADRNGMLVWQEPANPMRYTERSRTEVAAQLDGLIERDYNRPSVVVWSLYNEEWGIGHHDVDETLWTDAEKQQFLADLYRSVRERDSTRIVCDNSGWAHVATDVNDYHRYFVSPDQAESWAADLEHIRHYPADNYTTTEFDDPDAPIVVSELGTWGFGDADALRERYGGDPHWFDHDFLVETLKKPAGVDERFRRTTLPDVFDDYADLAASWQDREFASVKHLLEEMRVRDEIAGYVLTELSDIEWEFNGLADYHRTPKSFASALPPVNGPIAVVATPETHVAWTGRSFDVSLTVVNDTGESVSGTLEWSLDRQRTGETVSVPAHDTVSLTTTVTAPAETDEAARTTELIASFAPRDESITTTEPITIVDGDRRATPSVTVYAEGALASRLAEEGIPVTHTLSDAVDVAVTTEITSRIDQFASDGGAVVHVPDRDGEMRTGGPFTYRSLPRSESWNLVAGFYYQDSTLLDDLCSDRHLGWEFDGLYPYAVATDLNPSIDRVHVGYVEGWIANWSSPFVVRGHGSGSMTALTLRIGERYGRHPVATVVCNRLLRWLSQQI
ncbi:glycoside hydrolase family 2 protein [Natronococcus wangiae]|uniref:glycoside hydrolase family 2 protein n=1 Tax=Natronococcus wangiae TaxID=3068275 RepID=UPI00273D1952|nr:sugar-binding domain-containing protein [Natronococcus sp. AD5]